MNPPATSGPQAPRILAYVDDSRYWVPALVTVGAYARATGGSVTLLATTWSQTKREAAFARAREILDLPPERVTILSRVGLVENALPSEARSAPYDLVVVGRLGSLDWLTNGLIALHLVRHIPTDVLVVRGRAEKLTRFLVTTGGPRHGSANVRVATGLASVLGARVTVVHVRSALALTEEAHDALEESSDAPLLSTTPEALHLADMQNLLRRANVRGSVKIRTGPVVDEILAEITEGPHDLLVLGAHHEEPGDAFLFQDIMALLLRASPVSCLVVRRPASDADPEVS